MTTSTIFALASGAGRAALAVLRISGVDSARILHSLAGKLPPPRRASLRYLRDATGEVLDQAIIVWFPAPGSYTGEDAAELHLHGGPAVLSGVADALTALGARPAEPGEFTRRAFLHGRLDLTEAEGIADLIAAETSQQRRQALAQAGGALARRSADWTAQCARLLAHQEAAIEFADDDLPNDLGDRARTGSKALGAEIRADLAEAPRGERLRDGLVIAILGAPNAGKSSLLNVLAEREAAIVSPIAGTTRDIVEIRLDLGGVPVTLCDTAGLRETAEAIEGEGVRRALARAERADLCLALFAADVEPDPWTLALLGPDTVTIATKSDLGPPTISGALAISTRTGAGIAALRDTLTRAAATRAGGEGLLTRPRHRAALNEAAEWLDQAAGARHPELVAEALRATLRSLGRLSGRVDVESILDIVFKDFCIGK
ncbi:tRNA uridine-5-carboxymethylaminomethyl(34) synthesis GTPase MnmE [Plastoroseomonas arctica]|uniref:tRNA modification GTPase MnmE n=1 Tax=Plastoroseomonas arctica TaxID=1509237 RepID=A0AAF1K2N9_9PROT|nr:tRNA uridine-5-carboxymethylaminomethyl(34) synthesis GTPase MnmE [Plastoroseomonas arctica]